MEFINQEEPFRFRLPTNLYPPLKVQRLFIELGLPTRNIRNTQRTAKWIQAPLSSSTDSAARGWFSQTFLAVKFLALESKSKNTVR